MKRYFALIFVVLLLFLTVSPTFAFDDEISEGLEEDIIDFEEEMPEEVLEEVIDFFERYNQFVLITNKCVGAFEYDDSLMYVKSDDYLQGIGKEDGFYEYDFDDDPFFNPYVNMYYNYVDSVYKKYEKKGYLVTDERIKSFEDLKSFIVQFLFKEYSIAFGTDAYVLKEYKKGNWGDWLYDPLLPPMFFSDNEGNMYISEPLKQNATLFERYIDINSIEILKYQRGGYTTIKARGASQFRDGKVQECDSDVYFEMYFDPYDDYFNMRTKYAIRDHIDPETFKNYELDKHLLDSIDKEKVYKFNNKYMDDLGAEEYCYYKVESDVFRSIVDVYDYLYYTCLDDFINYSPAEGIRPHDVYGALDFYRIYYYGYATNMDSKIDPRKEKFGVHYPYLAETDFGLMVSDRMVEGVYYEEPVWQS